MGPEPANESNTIDSLVVASSSTRWISEVGLGYSKSTPGPINRMSSFFADWLLPTSLFSHQVQALTPSDSERYVLARGLASPCRPNQILPSSRSRINSGSVRDQQRPGGGSYTAPEGVVIRYICWVYTPARKDQLRPMGRDGRCRG